MPVSFSRPTPGQILSAAPDLPAQAQQLLSEGELARYRELFPSLAYGDRQRSYWATLALIDVGLQAHSASSAPRRPELILALSDAALTALEQEPREPTLLSRTAAIFDRLRLRATAAELLAAALRLDPHLPHATLARTPRLSAVGLASDDTVRGELTARAEAVAARALPADGMTLSLCMIVRDEQEMLPRCLAAIAGAVDEIVIVDTGSRDATVEIARSFGARVIEREWTGSFAEARNVAFDAAASDWLMYLDADEVLVAEDAVLLRTLTGRTWREAFYLAETNYTGEIDDGTAVTHNALRVFRNRPEYRFEGRVHEQIAQRLPAYLPERIEVTPIRVEHYGYLGAVSSAREKSRRNLELLRLQQAEAPATPFLHYNLGSEYAAAGDLASALGEFERSWTLLQGESERGSHEFAPALLRRFVAVLRASSRPADALSLADEGLERFPDFTDLVFERALAFRALGERESASEQFERCIELGDAHGYTARVGCGTYLPRIQLAEIAREDGDPPAAIALLERCLHEYPQFAGSVLPYTSALLARGASPEAAVAELERQLPSPSPSARLMLGTALYEAGASAAGELQFRAVLERQPHSSRARVALGESLLAQRRYAEAAAVAAAVAVDDPLASLACRTELFARIVDAEPSAFAATLERAERAGMAAEELDLFRAWAQLTSSGSTTIEPAAAAVPLLATMLEALLRVQDFTAFELLLGLLGKAPLEDRERRDLLAEMYLRRGFAASAAEEWMTICREQPDASALMGLARVAVVRGMAREADVFADAALVHDPENEAAARLLARRAAS
jgi:tetratricopeptide (TPR) repeat protein